MKTPDLIDTLAAELRPAPAVAAVRVVVPALGVGLLAALAVVLLVFGVQPDLDQAERFGPLAMKLAYATALASIAVLMTVSLARPAAPGIDARWIAAPVVVLAAGAALSIATAPAATWPSLLLGGSWSRCPWRIVGLSTPMVVALFAVIRTRAPTQPRRTGAAIGLLAGAGAAALYALACTEQSPAFVLIWYSLGVAIAAGLCAAVAPRVLRW